MVGANRKGFNWGFTQFDMNSLSVSVSILDCIPLRFFLETDTEIDREFLSNFQNISLGISTKSTELESKIRPRYAFGLGQGPVWDYFDLALK